MHRQLLQHDATYGYRFVPGLKARVPHEAGGYLVRVNSSGFRCDHEFVPERQPGTFRVLLFGDSYTAGDGVSNRQRYGDLLEQQLDGLEVYNFGLSGTGTDQQYLIFRDAVGRYEHDLVIVGTLVENIRRNVARYRKWDDRQGQELVLPKPYFVRSREGDLSLHHVPVPKEPLTVEQLPETERAAVDQGGRLPWLRQAVHRMGPKVKDLAQRVTRYQPLPGYDRSDHPAWLLMQSILQRFATEAPGPVLVCPIPLYQHIEQTADASAYRARFQELHDPPKLSVHDPLDDLWRYDVEERRGFRFASDCHLTPAGHRALADSLAVHLRARMNDVGSA